MYARRVYLESFPVTFLAEAGFIAFPFDTMAAGFIALSFDTIAAASFTLLAAEALDGFLIVFAATGRARCSERRAAVGGLMGTTVEAEFNGLMGLGALAAGARIVRLGAAGFLEAGLMFSLLPLRVLRAAWRARRVKRNMSLRLSVYGGSFYSVRQKVETCGEEGRRDDILLNIQQ